MLHFKDLGFRKRRAIVSLVMVALSIPIVWSVIARRATKRQDAEAVRRIPTTSPAQTRPVIVRLVGRHHVIMITAGPAGPRYSASTREGVAMVTNLTLEQLRAGHPEIYRQVDPSGIAANAPEWAGETSPETSNERLIGRILNHADSLPQRLEAPHLEANFSAPPLMLE